MVKIQEVEEVFRDLFREEEGMIKSIETIYELPKNRNDFIKLIISIHGLSADDISIIHTKFIFKVDLEKVNLVSNSFIYLYDINCNYHKIEFKNIYDMRSKLEFIISSNDFGKDLQILSDFIEAPAMFLNYYMRRNNILNYSIFGVVYEPKFKTVPCSRITFDFKININNNYFMYLSIKKDDSSPSNVFYSFQLKFMDDVETYKTDTLHNIHFFIGSCISRMLDKNLKNI